MPAKKPTPKPITLNEEQQAVVSERDGFYQVVAGPGSGKSATLVSRFSELIQEGVSPDDILSLSFTRTAAKNLRDRVEAQVGELSINRTVAGSVTFHSLALQFAQLERHEYDFELAEFPLASEPVAGKICGDSARKHDVDPRSLRSVASVYRRMRIRPLEAIRTCENNLDAKGLKLALAYKTFDKSLREAGLLDFDALMFYMAEILAKKKDVRDRWQYFYVMADECQDNCQTDWQILKLLSEKHGNLLCVGDPGQNLFSFRGSDSKLFLNMEEMFPGTQKLFLATNYRSTPELVSYLREIGPVPELAEKFHTPNASGPAPVIRGFVSPSDEVNWVVGKIREGL